MVTLKIKRRRNTTKKIDKGIETQAKDRIAVNIEITVSTAMKIITSNKIMETPTVIKVEVTVVTQEADPVTITTKGKETKTETETTTDTTATPNTDTTPATKSNAEKMRHTRLTSTMKAMMDKTLTFWTKAMAMPLTMNFTLPTKSFTTQTRPMTRKKMMNLPKIQMTQAWLLCRRRQCRHRTNDWKDLPIWSNSASRWIVEYQDCWTYCHTDSETRNWLTSQNCTHDPQRSSSKMTHSPTSLSWFWK